MRHIGLILFLIAAALAWGCEKGSFYPPDHPDGILPVAQAATLAEFNADSAQRGCGEVISSKILALGNLTFEAVYYLRLGGVRTGHCIPQGITWDVDGTAAAFTFPDFPRGDIAQVVRGTYPSGMHTIRAAVTLKSGKVWNDTLTVGLP